MMKFGILTQPRPIPVFFLPSLPPLPSLSFHPQKKATEELNLGPNFYQTM